MIFCSLAPFDCGQVHIASPPHADDAVGVHPLNMADPFAFSRQQRPAAHAGQPPPQQQSQPPPSGSGHHHQSPPPHPQQEWGNSNAWSHQQQQQPDAGSMGMMGGGGGGGGYPQASAPLQHPLAQHGSAGGFNFGGSGGGGTGGFNIAEVAANPMAQLGMKYGKEMMQSSLARYLPGAAALWAALRYYFDVNNSYVKNKLWKVLFPWLSRKWDRVLASESGGVSRHAAPDGAGQPFAPPIHDENAPDLYIPLMSFITFVLVTGLLKGTRMTFTPEVLVTVTSSSLLTSTLELVFLKGGMYLTAAEGCTMLDLVAYAGYKYVGMVIIAVTGLLFGQQAYYAVSGEGAESRRQLFGEATARLGDLNNSLCSLRHHISAPPLQSPRASGPTVHGVRAGLLHGKHADAGGEARGVPRGGRGGLAAAGLDGRRGGRGQHGAQELFCAGGGCGADGADCVARLHERPVIGWTRDAASFYLQLIHVYQAYGFLQSYMHMFMMLFYFSTLLSVYAIESSTLTRHELADYSIPSPPWRCKSANLHTSPAPETGGHSTDRPSTGRDPLMAVPAPGRFLRR